jgi:hypothetical protein
MAKAASKHASPMRLGTAIGIFLLESGQPRCGRCVTDDTREWLVSNSD